MDIPCALFVGKIGVFVACIGVERFSDFLYHTAMRRITRVLLVKTDEEGGGGV